MSLIAPLQKKRQLQHTLHTPPAFFRRLHQVLRFKVFDYTHYIRAFCHSSTHHNVEDNNERLEFLGDTILDAIIAEYLFQKYPYKHEGFLTEMKSKIVNRQNLNLIGKKLNLNDLIDVHQTRQLKSDFLGNTLEALIGAIYLDKGYEKTYCWVEKNILQPHVAFDELEAVEPNIKNKLFQWATKHRKTIDYVVLAEEKQRNKKIRFTIGLLIDQKCVIKATGFTKKEAEHLATLEYCTQNQIS